VIALARRHHETNGMSHNECGIFLIGKDTVFPNETRGLEIQEQQHEVSQELMLTCDVEEVYFIERQGS